MPESADVASVPPGDSPQLGTYDGTSIYNARQVRQNRASCDYIPV